MMRWKIPLFKIFWDENDIKNVISAIEHGMFWATGPNIERFESLIAEKVRSKYAVAFNSGTSALHATLLVYGIGAGDEVIVPSFTFIATANSVLFVDAKPVFGDIEEETYGLDPEDVKEKITPRTKAIIPIHYGGLPCHIKELKEVAEDYKCLLIEDAAESLGAKICKQPVGSFGDAAMLSFCANKIITTGEGGMVVTDSRDTYERLRLIRSHGRLETQNYFSSVKPFEYVTLGYNWRMSNITAGLGISQTMKLNKLVKMRRTIAGYYYKKLSEMEGIELIAVPRNYFHVYQMYTIRVKSGSSVRDNLKMYLAQQGIMTKVYFHPVHLTHLYRARFHYMGGELPVTEKASEHVLTLPMYPTLSEREIDSIADNIRHFIKERSAANTNAT